MTGSGSGGGGDRTVGLERGKGLQFEACLSRLKIHDVISDIKDTITKTSNQNSS